MNIQLARIFGGLALAFAAPLGATTVALPEPGYLVVDGIYYGYGLRSTPLASDRALLNSRDSAGFHFDTTPALGSCARADGSAITEPASGEAQFVNADQFEPPATAGLAVIASATSGVVSVDLVACEAATVVMLRTRDGDTVCSARIGFPLHRGVCAALDASDPGFVYFDAFED